MTPREFVENYIQEKRGILRDRFYSFAWNRKGFDAGVVAMESLDIDCTDIRSALKDVHDSITRLYRIKAETHLALFSQDPSPDDGRKRYLCLLRLFLEKSPDEESIDDFEKRFKALVAAEDKPVKEEPAQDQEQPAP